MKSSMMVRTVAGALIVTALPGVAMAQAWSPGAEVVGQPIQVTTNGVTNTVYLDAGGSARIMTPAGNTVPGTWSAASGQLCLNNGRAQECWAYNGPFQAGLPVSLTSPCGVSSWLVASTNTPAPPPPAPVERGERGR